jgi:adenine-specific DNA-methyltransferase
MPTTQQLRQRLVNKLNELFQLDQPDLDFGFYRIMHSKAREVQGFINNDLLHIVSEAFGDEEEADKAELKARIDREIELAKEYGAPDPENSPKVKEARDAYNAAQNTAGDEAEVYDHLYRFFGSSTQDMESYS